MIEVTDTFHPEKYSIEENEFLLGHIGEPPAVALRDVPKGVTLGAVKPAIERVFELTQLEAHRGVEWVGVDRVKLAIETFLLQTKRWADDRRRGAPRFPSMAAFDSKNRPHLGATGSDSGFVSTYFDKEGQRKPFGIPLITADADTWAPEWSRSAKEIPSASESPTGQRGIVDNPSANRLECVVCGHTESYNPDSRKSFGLAKSRLAKHLLKATKDSEAHREAHTIEFGS